MHKPSKEPVVKYAPKTWSAFTEYSRLEMLLKGFTIQSMIDVPSTDVGDFKQKNLFVKTYIGACRDKENACVLQAQYGSERYSFYHLNIIVDPIPKVDLVFAWDLLTTMKRSEIYSTLLQFKKSGAKFLLMTHDPAVTKNKKNKTGQPQAINWKLEPYNFPDPIISFGPFALWSFDTL